MLKMVIKSCEQCGSEYAYYWLKNIKDRVQPQNSSVNDEELAQAKKDAYNNVLDKIEYDSENPTFDDGWSAAIWYLKKRNAQPKLHWKPNEKQIMSLYNSIPNAAFCERETLTQLYVDLKKLKE